MKSYLSTITFDEEKQPYDGYFVHYADVLKYPKYLKAIKTFCLDEGLLKRFKDKRVL